MTVLKSISRRATDLQVHTAQMKCPATQPPTDLFWDTTILFSWDG